MDDESQFITINISQRTSSKPNEEIEELKEDEEVKNKFKLFKQFDVLPHPPCDHQYLETQRSSKKKDCFQLDSKVVKRISKEWMNLKNNLPEQIFVRVFETRIDLMRAIIVGSQGTPYQDGLFLFDIIFPVEYPNQPPIVHYHSHGLHLNPNLYENGQVCLSLLNTWYGSKSEKWIPGVSTVLQLLVSIQALVLNAQPYFNEPLNWATFFAKQNSLDYNKEAFVFSCKMMLYMLRKPPVQFEDLVAGHFRDRAHSIIMNCKTFMDEGAMVNQVFPDLVRAFHENGANCIHLLNLVNGTVKKETKVRFLMRFIMRTLRKLGNVFILFILFVFLQNFFILFVLVRFYLYS